MKLLMRWTIGPVSHVGFEILEESIRLIKKLYGKEVDLIICHNNINDDQLSFIKKLKVLHLNQHKAEKFWQI